MRLAHAVLRPINDRASRNMFAGRLGTKASNLAAPIPEISQDRSHGSRLSKDYPRLRLSHGHLRVPGPDAFGCF